ncbi:hypothetical protein HNQ51_000927 [Inhella inkyongensis]|uniref:Ice-binding protein C-terminal domain-containing protein n=1 Tax=Inhella inkyongensis TaxID=392593 RepID=A0A840S494_9BURK|nr:PEP-CTERM sorting domain-containing protein [Inhella inkyongensis]MBB5203634.1 hypothetical protein [Inhella inkyongensis]
MKKVLLALSVLLAGAAQALPVNLTEDFEASFPTWESGWLGSNSNLRNYYGVGQGRGNNPDGLWIHDNGLDASNNSLIQFGAGFGAQITHFSIDVTTFVQGALFEAYDMSGQLLNSSAITVMGGAFTDPGNYQTISFSSTNGVSRFRISNPTNGIEGNTSIDNVAVTLNGNTQHVPEPATLALTGLGLLGAGFARRARKG